MKSFSRLSPSVVGAAVILIFFCLLFVSPRLLRTTHYKFAPSGSEIGVSFGQLLDTALPVLNRDPSSSEKERKLGLRQLFPQENSLILVNFWASWCAPCVEELPSLEYLGRQLSQSKQGTPIRLVTISVDERAEDVHALFRKLGISFNLLVLHDKNADISRAVGTVRFPESYLVDKTGKILYKWIGPQNWLSADVLTELHTPQGR